MTIYPQRNGKWAWLFVVSGRRFGNIDYTTYATAKLAAEKALLAVHAGLAKHVSRRAEK